MKGFGQALTLGGSIASSILCGFLLGSWLDQLFKTKPIFLILGILCGVVSAFLFLIRMTRSN